ncbi:GGDEF domain-containing response regulator [Geomesophilobacter sediminis]|uniref:diguanylate cyclase n=1 Tax=Geomesophilobacter sediminis TaxID=2798584 RepID=A0A8J7M1Z2_9BACT|nr:response regulator [Geomesophilobacter sediminis]MBJ6727142.1 diguanylate cyclase [Geomesophilobacter sediminis]
MSTPAPAINMKLKKIRESFIKKLPEQYVAIREIHVALMANPSAEPGIEDLHRRIHTMKGATASFALPSVASVAAAAERLAEEPLGDRSKLNSAWHRQMQELLDKLEKSLDELESVEEMEFQAPELIVPTHHGEGRERKLIHLCEDDPYQRMSLATQIQCFGYEVVSFAEPEELRKAAKNRPDAIVMDVIFPNRPTGGTEEMAELRNELKEDIPMVFISSRDDLGARLSAVRAGSSAYFVKPIDITALCSTLSDLTTTETPEPNRVLIVDDDVTLAEYHATILQQAGMETQTLSDPLKAMEPLSSFKPDLILMDMYMPGFNGMELAKAIRQIDAYFSIPIVFLSSETNADKQFDAMRMGGDEFLTKPVKPQHLVTSVAVRAERMKVIRSLMVRDSMTGLYNHSASKEQLNLAIQMAHREDQELSIAMVDIDHFKKVNDDFGHPIGDRVLITLSRLLQQRLRKTDIVGRCGGEEFIVVLPGCNADQAMTMLDELRKSYASITFPGREESFNATFSCGIATLADFDDAAVLWKAADDALFKAKKNGRNRVELADGAGRQ